MKKYASSAELISAYMTRLYENGMTTTSGGNLSYMDDNGSLWISPSGIDKAHLMPDDIMEVRADGTVIGKHKPSSEYPFHLAVRRVRPDMKAVLHAHPSALVALSLARMVPDIDLFPVGVELGKGISVAKYALPGSELLGSYIASKFAEGYNAVMLENHGICIGASTMYEAYRIFESLEYSARVQIAAAGLGKKVRHLTAEQLAAGKSPKLYEDGCPRCLGTADDEDEVRGAVVEMAARCYKNKLFSAANGVFASRLSDGGFVITPEGCDVMLLEKSDLVKIKNGKKTAGAEPSSLTYLAELIFDRHPDISSVAVSRATDIMGFAVTDAEFDSHLIPEGYICLRNVSHYPYGTVESSPESIADGLTMKTPIAIVENDFAVVAGTSPLNAYDRLEVMEFGARSLNALATLGVPVVRISPDDIKDIEVAFGL